MKAAFTFNKRLLALLFAITLLFILIICAEDVQAASVKSFNGFQEASSYVREKTVDRETNISFEIKSAGEFKSNNDVLQKLVRAAFVNTGNPEEGDYISSHINGVSCTSKNVSNGRENNLMVVLNVDYYTTAKEEAAVDVEVDRVLDELNVSGKSEYKKAKLIYDYITTNTSYDYENSGSSYRTQYTAYGALIDGTAVCQGYSALVYRMMTAAGLETRIVSGYANGRHSWNVVKIEGKNYYLDATWDEGGKTDYFLKGKNFKNHEVDANTGIKMSSSDYNSCKKHCYKSTVTKKAKTDKDGCVTTKCTKCGRVKSTVSVAGIGKVYLTKTEYKQTGKKLTPKVVVKTTEGKKISSKYYTVKYSGGRTETGTYKVKVSFKGKYKGSKTLKFNII